ncbi:dipeptidyl-peptidase III [Martiniozyma asiatica (nom. inval.)]|nr:dipeptidyl-peptidase III [Martiniozyma asiatica]
MSSARLFADSGAPITRLSAAPFFSQLNSKEKLYAHHFSKAGHWGSRAVLRSVSPESEPIFNLVLAIHHSVNGKYEKLASAETVKAYLEYASMVLANLGNYKSFGDCKFIPRISASEFGQLVNNCGDSVAIALFNDLKSILWDSNGNLTTLGNPDEGHVSGYYLNVVNEVEGKAIDKALGEAGIMLENTRFEKINDDAFVVHVASAFIDNATGYYPEKIDFKIDGKDATLSFKFGDHSKEFGKVVEHLLKAKEYAANETQVKMLEQYIASFQTGSMKAHYDSQIHWVKDLKPQVETNIGFIETYRDYLGTKGEWECLVAMVNKERTEKFGELVDNAKKYIVNLPWGNEFEKDQFTPPDFTSLEVLTFAGSGCPAGINIPNYDKIRINIGFKNVSLGNVISARSTGEHVTFVSDEDQSLYEKYSTKGFEVQVGIHELLGHGTGKLLLETSPGEFNFDKASPPLGLDGKPVQTYYKYGQTWGSLFGSIAGAYEECRAECVAMFLGTNPEILSTFGFKKEEFEDVCYIMYLNMMRSGFMGMEYYHGDGKWGQAHCQARYAIFKTCLDAEVVKYENGVLVMKREDINKARDCIGDLLRKLHILKCSGNVAEGTELFVNLTTIPQDIYQWREDVLKNKKPRRQLIQANTFVDDNGDVFIKEYQENELGMIESFYEREC